jgi:hypothetical protein
MALLAWLARILLFMFVAQLVLRLLFGRRSVASRRPSRPAGPERAGGALVRDPHCGTFIPPSRAIQVGTGAAAQYFCSEGCRAAYAAAHGH